MKVKVTETEMGVCHDTRFEWNWSLNVWIETNITFYIFDL